MHERRPSDAQEPPGWRELARDELTDLGRLAMLAVAIVLIWIVFLGLRHGAILFGPDALQLDWPLATEALRAGGHPERLVYRASWVGGARLVEMVGLAADYRLQAALGLSAADALSFHALLTQVELGFFGIVGVQALRRHWHIDGDELRWWLALSIGVGSAFIPYHGVELAAGHLMLVEGVLPFAAPAALWLSACTGRTPTLVSVALTAVVLRTAVGGTQRQTLLDAAVFLAPLFLYLAAAALRTRGQRAARPLAVVTATCLGGVGLGLTWFAMTLEAALGPDAARRLGGPVLTWSRGVNTLLDWSTLLTAGADLFVSRPPPWLLETQFPAGLALAGLVLVPWRRARKLGVALLLSLLVLAAFTMQVEPVAAILLRLVPPLGSFRVPMRALSPFLTLMTWMALAAVSPRPAARSSPPTGPIAASEARGTTDNAFARLVRPLAAATLLLGLAVLPGAIGEGLALATFWAWAIVFRVRPAWTEYAPSWFAPTAFAVASVAAVARLLPIPCPESALLGAIGEERRAIEQSPSRTRNALERIFVDHELPTGPNGFAAAGIAQPYGYWYPTRRQLELYAALQGEEPDPGRHVLRPATLPPSAETRALAMLYDVREWRHHDDNGWVVVPQPTLGPAWFPARWDSVGDMKGVARALLERAEHPDAVRAHALIDRAPPGIIDPACGTATAPTVQTRDGGQRVEIEGTSPGDCALVLSMNWTARHVAYVQKRGAQAAERAETWPVYGALLGVQVPAGDWSLTIEPRLPWPQWGREGSVLGGLLVLLAALGSLRLRAVPILRAPREHDARKDRPRRTCSE